MFERVYGCSEADEPEESLRIGKPFRTGRTDTHRDGGIRKASRTRRTSFLTSAIPLSSSDMNLMSEAHSRPCTQLDILRVKCNPMRRISSPKYEGHFL